MHPAGFEPMLAAPSFPLSEGPWAYEPKLDGWRAVVHVGDGVRVFSRPGRELTSANRVLAALADVVPSGTVLDGELVSDSGRAGTFYRLAGELAGATGAVSFVAFDVLALAGTRVTHMPYAERRTVLVDLGLVGPSWCTTPSWTDVAPEELLSACAAEDVEGVVAKRTSSNYVPGQRSRTWVKLKTEQWRRSHGPRRLPPAARMSATAEA